MVKLIILFRVGGRSPQFDQNYNDFLMKLESLPGIIKKAVNTVYSGPGGLTPFQLVVEAYFHDRDTLVAALTSPVGVETGELLQAFAGPDAIIMFADVLEEEIVDQDSSQAQQ